MSTIRFYLFGKFRIESDLILTSRIEHRKAEELLVYLLLYRDQPQSREHLADALWGEIAAEQAKSYLRKALWQLQSILEAYSEQGLLIIDGEWLQVNPQFDFWLDIEVLRSAFKTAQGAHGKDLEEEQAEIIREAVELYQGDLLEGWYKDWCLFEREHFQYLYIAMLDKLMDHCEAHGDYEKGLEYGERILSYDRAHERTHRQLMRLHYLAGDRTSAIRQYQKCVMVLRNELNIEPSEDTKLLHVMIRQDRLDPPSVPYGNQSPRVDKGQLKEVLIHLSAFHKELSRIQTRLTEDMNVIHKAIKGH